MGYGFIGPFENQNISDNLLNDIVTYKGLFAQGYTLYSNYLKKPLPASALLPIGLPPAIPYSKTVKSSKPLNYKDRVNQLRKQGLDVRVHNLAFKINGEIDPNGIALFIRDPRNRPAKIHDGEITNITLDTFLEYMA
jgi:hypothetical protein